jgi:uncharacterized protein (TIGR03435 family)
MNKIRNIFGTRRKIWLRAATLVGLAAPLVVGLTSSQRDQGESLASLSVAQKVTANSASPSLSSASARISAYADARCGVDQNSSATECRLEALWVATHCEPDTLERSAKMAQVGTIGCVIPDGGFAFDVVSIKPRLTSGPGEGSTPKGGVNLDGYRSLNAPLTSFIISAYNPQSLQRMRVEGGPKWLEQNRYDFEGKYAPEVADAMNKLSRNDYSFVLGALLQRVLKERMNFAAKFTTEDVPAYDLVVGKNGPKLQDADLTASDAGDVAIRRDSQAPGMLRMTAKGTRISYLASVISGPAGRPVFDKTGLTGMYDMILEYEAPQALQSFSPAGSAAVPPSTPTLEATKQSIFDAVEALGLKLVPSRGPMTVVVIEHIEIPSGN